MAHQGPAGMVRAVRVTGVCAPADLRGSDVSRPPVGAGEVLVAVHSAAVHRSDVLSIRGALPIAVWPRVPGRDFAGIVVDGPAEMLGAEVWGTGGGDLGFTRDGSHSQILVIPADAAVPLPPGLSLLEAGACGLAYFTAAEAIRRAGEVTRDVTVLVTGAAGGVGSAAAAIARWRGARVIGTVAGTEARKRAERSGIETVIDTEHDDVAAAVEEATAGRGADIAVDTVGGAVLNVVVRAMGTGGGVCLLSSPPSVAAGFDLLAFYRRELRLVGLNTGRLTMRHAAAHLRGLLPGFADGALPAPRIAARYRLEDAAAAYRHVEEGRPAGRVVIVPCGTAA